MNHLLLVFFTKVDLINENKMKAFLDHIDVNLIKPIRFDAIERAQKEFAIDKYAEMSDDLSKRGMLFFKGANDGFVMSIRDVNNGLFTWRVFLTFKKKPSHDQIQKWIKWSFDLVEAFPVLFGAGYSQEEFDIKHKAETSSEQGFRSTSFIGASISDFHKFLPGIYWLTIFGKPLVDFFSIKKIESTPHTEFYKLKKSQAALVLSKSIFDDDLKTVIEKEQGVAKHLGREYFFDRDANIKTLRPVPNLFEE